VLNFVEGKGHGLNWGTISILP